MATDRKLTDAKIETLPIPATGYVLYRDRDAGLAVRVTEAGGRAFTLDYRTSAGRRRRMTLGDWTGDFGIVHARAKAAALKVEIEAGGDPLRTAAEAVVEYKGRPTVARLADEWMRQRIRPKRRPRTVVEYERLLRDYVLPKLKDKAVADVETSDVLDLVNAVGDLKNAVGKKKHVTANRVRAVLSAMFNHALAAHQKNPWLDHNPVTKAVERYDEEKRTRSLEDDEFERLQAALDHCGSRQAADVVRLLAWTGARKGETLCAKWSEFDLDKGIWTKPSHHTKQKRIHVTALHPQAVELLRGMKERARDGAVYVFPGKDGQPLTSIKTSWRNLMKRAKIEDFRIHDLRHAFASRLIDQGASLPEIGVLLGHTQSATTERYAHLSVQAQRRTLGRLPSRPKPVALLE